MLSRACMAPLPPSSALLKVLRACMRGRYVLVLCCMRGAQLVSRDVMRFSRSSNFISRMLEIVSISCALQPG